MSSELISVSKNDLIVEAFKKQHSLKCAEQILLVQTKDYFDCRAPLSVNTLTEEPLYLVCKVLKVEQPIATSAYFRVTAYDHTAKKFTFNASSESELIDSVAEAYKNNSKLSLYGIPVCGRYGVQLKKVVPISSDMKGRITPKLPGITRKASSLEVTKAYAAYAANFNPGDSAKVRRLTQLFSLSPSIVTRIAQQNSFKDLAHVLSALSQRTDADKYRRALSCLRELNVNSYLQSEEDLSTKQRGAYKPRRTYNRSAVEEAIAFGAKSGFSLTPSQANQVNNIINSQQESKHGNGLLSGDVGTGKSIVIAALTAAAQLSSMSVLVMAPTPEIANQLKEQILNFGGRNIKVLCDGSTYKYKQDGTQPAIYLGTTALLHADEVTNKTFDLSIVDEEQSFGIEQKYSFISSTTYHLLSTATAIPATMQIAMSCRRDTFKITDRPSTRRVTTKVHDSDNLFELMASVDETLRNNNQVVVLAPIARNKKDNEYQKSLSVRTMQENWEKSYPGKTTVFHGGQSKKERASNFNDILTGKASIIIATTAIELGLNFPSLTQMIVTEPARYGLRQLHQLRGRLGRFGDASRFDLLPITPLSERAAERLEILCRHDDGFLIAEKELALRGFGSLNYGDYEQSGNPTHIIPCYPVTSAQIQKYATNILSNGDFNAA